MSVRAISWVWENSSASGNDRLVLLAIADSAEHDGSNAWPSVRTIAKKCLLSERTVQRAIRALVSSGELIVEEQEGGGRFTPGNRRPNRYALTGVAERHPKAEDAPVGVTRRSTGVTDVLGKQAPGVTPVSPNPSFEQEHPSAADLALTGAPPEDKLDPEFVKAALARVASLRALKEVS